MKIQVISPLMVIVFLIMSCAKDMQTKDQSIRFTGSISQLSATTNTGSSTTTWSTSDTIGIFMVDTILGNVIENNSNRQYKFNGSQFNPIIGHEIYYPVDNSKKASFIAYYPYSTGSQLESNVQIDVANQQNLSRIDFLYAKSNNSGAGFSKSTGVNVPLSFDHKLSKIVIKPEPGAGLDSSSLEWKRMVVKLIGFNTLCHLNLNNGTLTGANTISPISPFVRTVGTTYEAIVIPATYPNAGDFTMTFEIDNNTYTMRSLVNQTFESGKEYTYIVTISKTGVVLGNVIINDWTTNAPRFVNAN